MKFKRNRLFAILIIILISLIFIESLNTNKKRNKNKNKNLAKTKRSKSKSKTKTKIQFRLSAYKRLIKDDNAWKKDIFLKELKDKMKNSAVVNREKHELFRYVIGKCLSLFGGNDSVIMDYVKSLDKSQISNIMKLFFIFQHSMDLRALHGLVNMNVPGISMDKLIPSGGKKVMDFLNEHIRMISK